MVSGLPMRVKKRLFLCSAFWTRRIVLTGQCCPGDVAFEEGDDGLAGLDPGQEHAWDSTPRDDGRLEVGDDRDRYPEMRPWRLSGGYFRV